MGADAALTPESPPHEPFCQFRARPLMDYLLSDHARKRMQKRKIRVEWVEATLTDPLRTENDVYRSNPGSCVTTHSRARLSHLARHLQRDTKSRRGSNRLF